jgi:hypothetical protein
MRRRSVNTGLPALQMSVPKLESVTYGRGCANERFRNESGSTGFVGFLRCKKVLHYSSDWRYICAMLIGYARVSTDEQDTAAQVKALKAAECERV